VDLGGPLIEILKTAMEVTFRPSKTLVLLVTVSDPKQFYQILRVSARQLEARISKYLLNARDSRGLPAQERLVGKIYVIGYCEKSKFDEVKFLIRKKIGAEASANFISQVDTIAPEECPTFRYHHNAEGGMHEIEEPAGESPALRELVAKLTDLDVYSWLR
jgi:hypothetical protein